MTQILTVGHIFNKIRPKNKFFHCSQCMGFWVGCLIFLIFWFNGISLFPTIFFGIPLFGFLSSGTSYILNRIVDDDGFKISHG
jgi:hypothetical protein